MDGTRRAFASLFTDNRWTDDLIGQDEQFHIIYINEVLKRDEWHTFNVGTTRFNDEALRQAGIILLTPIWMTCNTPLTLSSAAEMTIHNMQEKQAAYNLISNNCQNFADNLLNAIQVGAHKQFATAFAVYQRATGHGDIKDLFKADTGEHPDEQPDSEASEAGHQNVVHTAQQLMHDHTSKLDFHPESLLKAFHHKSAS